MRRLRQKITLITFWSILSFFLVFDLEAARVQLIVVGDTLDKDIGEDVKSDIVNLTSQMESMGKGYIMPPIVLEGENCNREEIKKSLKNMHLHTDDTVFFYYSGHGSYDKTKGQFLQIPRLHEGKDIPRNEISGLIKGWVESQKIRLGIVITDMCNLRQIINVFIPQEAANAAEAPAAGHPKPQLWKALFLDSSGFVDVGSASQDEAAANLPKKYDQNGNEIRMRGSIFLNAFNEALTKNEFNRLSWETIFTHHISPDVKSLFKYHYPDGITLPKTGQIQLTQTVQIDSLADLNGGPEFINRNNINPNRAEIRVSPNQVRISSINTTISKDPVPVQARDGIRQGVQILEMSNPALAQSWKPGDVILSVNGIETRTPAMFAAVINQSPDISRSAWWKYATNVNVNGVTIVLRNNDKRSNFGDNEPVTQPKPKLGVVPESVIYNVETPDGMQQGLRISQVLPNTPAYGILNPGDIIIKIDNQPTPNDTAFRDAIAKARNTIKIYGWDSRTGDVKDFQPIPLNK